jgi:hypothetical protein
MQFASEAGVAAGKCGGRYIRGIGSHRSPWTASDGARPPLRDGEAVA